VDPGRPSPTAKRYAFTPKHNAKIPRAWERKPSTPFAPRNESQRIWKRYQFPDVNVVGASIASTGQSKNTEIRALKKSRLEGKEATAYITSWDEELHETKRQSVAANISCNQLTFRADKQSTYQGRIAGIASSVMNPTTISHGVEKLFPAHDVDRLITVPNTSQDVEDQGTADDMPVDQEKRPPVVKAASCNHEEFQGPNREAACAERLSPHDETVAGSPDSEGEVDRTEQNFPKELADFERAVSSQTEPLAADEEATGRIESGGAGEEDRIPARLPPKKCTAGDEQIGPKQSADGAAAVQLNNALGETSRDDKDIEQRQQVTDIDKQPTPSRAQSTPEAITNAEPNGSLGDNTRDVSALQNDDTEHTDDHGIPQQRETNFKTMSHDEVVRRSPCKDPMSAYGPKLIYVRQPVGLEIGATDSGDNENGPLESPPSQNLRMHVQDKTSRSPDVIQDEDTDYLHAFLTRAKAKRAAREASPQKVERISHSPVTRSRAALVPLSTNSASPKKTNKNEPDTRYKSEGLDMNREGSPCRRSGRIRVNRAEKPPRVTPSTIPVRRSNGTEFIFLQSIDTAQVALTTRANTKRNKGEAVMPKMKLQVLSQAQKSPSKSPKLRKGKEVSWKDEPTYFRVDADDVGGNGEKRKEEDKPRARKLRRLRAANGTPAPKKTTAGDELHVRTPVFRKRGKVKA
jgi:hypothetical protein